MGRRPHALIQEFFDRGPKLDDNSNRYQHTCKRCGELFPKGRIDSLTTHLLRRCSSLTELDRTWIYQQLQSDHLKAPRPAKRDHAETFRDIQMSESMHYQAELPPPFAQQQQSALETLAEVSGQHFSRAEARKGAQPPEMRSNDPAATVAEAIAEQALLAQLQGNGDLDGVSANPTAESNKFSYPDMPPPDIRGQKPIPDLDDGLAPAPTTQLADTILTTNQHSEQRQTHLAATNSHYDTGSEQSFQSFNIPIDMGFRMGEPTPPADLPWAQPTAVNTMPSFGTITLPQSDPMAGYGILSANARVKPRGRFDDVRRKEVSNIRKQGACIRCRMLKKPCSEGTPCKTCSTVESARIWRGKCVRTRLADEMTLWSTKLFHARADALVEATTVSSEKIGMSAQVAVSSLDNSEEVIFPIRQTRRREATDTVEGGLRLIWALDSEMAGEKFGTYARAHFEELVEAQPAPMKSILSKTESAAEGGGSSAPSGEHRDSQHDEKRSSYRSQTDLSKNVIELWTLTQLLTSAGSGKLTLRLSEDTDMDPASRRIIQAQLRAATESQCSKLCRIVLNELERRLLQRQQTSRLGTLLSALLLLNCGERMAGYYRMMDIARREDRSQDEAPVSGASDSFDVGLATDKTDASAASWPLEIPPSSIWPQGEHFADLLTSLLRIRALPPKTRITAEGVLESLREFTVPAHHMSGPPAKKSDEEQKEAAADWLDSLKLQAEPLKAKRDAEPPEPGDGLEAWSMRYVARVLLP